MASKLLDLFGVLISLLTQSGQFVNEFCEGTLYKNESLYFVRMIVIIMFIAIGKNKGPSNATFSDHFNQTS